MGCCSGIFKLVLLILNLVLFVLFVGLAVVGMLIKVNPGFLMGLLEKSVQNWPVKYLYDLVILIEYYGGPVAIVLIVLGLFVAIASMLGTLALLCKVKCLAILYLICMSLLGIVELALIIYLFAIPSNLNKVVEKLLDNTLEAYDTKGVLGEASANFWQMIGSGEGKLCCGIKGYTDFPDSASLPLSCCEIDATKPTSQGQTCDKNAAETKGVIGCEQKINEYIAANKTIYIVIPCCLFAYQIIVLVIMGCLCKHFHRD